MANDRTPKGEETVRTDVDVPLGVPLIRVNGAYREATTDEHASQILRITTREKLPGLVAALAAATSTHEIAKPKTLDKVVGAVKSVLGNPLVQQALTAFVLKKLTRGK